MSDSVHQDIYAKLLQLEDDNLPSKIIISHGDYEIFEAFCEKEGKPLSFWDIPVEAGDVDEITLE